MNAKDQAKQDYEANIQLMQDLMGRLDAVGKKLPVKLNTQTQPNTNTSAL